MSNYIAVVFPDDESAFSGLHELWRLDRAGDVTVDGAAVLHRDRFGHTVVATKETHPGLRTAVGVGIGALIGALAGPIGSAAGAAVAAGTAAGVGAMTGGLIGGTADVLKASDNDQAGYEASFAIKPGQSAVIAEVSEDSTETLNRVMRTLGGSIYRRKASVVRNDMWADDFSRDYLYPYDYEARFN